MKKYWIEELPGMPPLPDCPELYAGPDRPTATFVEEGHFVEYFEYPFDRPRTVALFYGPREFIIPSHPCFSTVRSLDRCSIAEFTYGGIFRTLRNHPESQYHYRFLKNAYEEKVADRLKLARLGCERERFQFVLDKQPWVLRVAPENLVAGYLGMTIGSLKDLKAIYLKP